MDHDISFIPPKSEKRMAFIKALWERQNLYGVPKTLAASFGKVEFDEFKALGTLKTSGNYIDYLCGKAFKMNNPWTEDKINSFLYDRDAGSGAFAEVLASFSDS